MEHIEIIPSTRKKKFPSSTPSTLWHDIHPKKKKNAVCRFNYGALNTPDLVTYAYGQIVGGVLGRGIYIFSVRRH